MNNTSITSASTREHYSSSPSPIWRQNVTNSSLPEVSSDSPKNLHDLMWLVPMVMGIVFFLIGVAWICIFALRKTELFTLHFCYRKWGCCPPKEKSKMPYDALTQEDVDTLYMKGKIFAISPTYLVGKVNTKLLLPQRLLDPRYSAPKPFYASVSSLKKSEDLKSVLRVSPKF